MTAKSEYVPIHLDVRTIDGLKSGKIPKVLYATRKRKIGLSLFLAKPTESI